MKLLLALACLFVGCASAGPRILWTLKGEDIGWTQYGELGLRDFGQTRIVVVHVLFFVFALIDDFLAVWLAH